MMKSKILLSNQMIELNINNNGMEKANPQSLGTVLSNFAFYGFKPSKSLLIEMLKLSEKELADFWKETENSFKSYFESVIEAKKGVVYKNFPSEVIEKTFAEYWIAQILMYVGLPAALFSESEIERQPAVISFDELKSLHIAQSNSLEEIYFNLVNKKVEYTPVEKDFIVYLVEKLNINSFDISVSPFKMNGVFISHEVMKKDGEVYAKNATDIIRLAAYVGAEGKSLNEKIAFFKFSRKERKVFLKMLLSISQYEEDFAARPETFKAFMKSLRPGEYSWAKKVSSMYNELYNKKVKSFNSKVENSENPWKLLSTRPGVFLRNFHKVYAINAKESLESFEKIVNELNVYQLLKFKKYIININDFKSLIVRPSSTWAKAKIIDNNKKKIEKSDQEALISLIDNTLSIKLNTLLPEGVMKGNELENIYLSSNDQEISVGRGTIYNIPEEINFIRTASYWTNKKGGVNGNFWFDNGFNFIHENEKLSQTICWNSNVNTELAVFSGDPVIANNEDKCATQIIDLNLDKLKEAGFKYAVWNILSYSNIKFNEAEKVTAMLQYVEDQNKGELFEPSKVDLQFDLKGNSLCKFVAYIDIQERKLVFLDMTLPGMKVSTAEANINAVKKYLPAVIDHIKLIPTVYDLVENVKEGSIPFVYSDKEVSIKEGKAFVFKNVNEENEFEKIDINSLLN